MTYEICTDVVVDLAYQKLAPSNESSHVCHNEVLVLLLLPILLFNTMMMATSDHRRYLRIQMIYFISSI